MIPTSSPLKAFKRKFQISFTLFLFTLVMGTAGYRIIDNARHSLMDYFYMTIITVSTVGYGEIIDLSHSNHGRAFTIFLIFAGISIILYFMSNVTAFFIEGDLNEIFRRRKMEKYIAGLDGHYIVCGAGRLGYHILDELHLTRRSAVAIDNDNANLEVLHDRYPDTGTLEGDATDSEILRAAGIERAAGLIAATSNDKDNLVITLTARQMNPYLRIVSRCNDIKNIDRLKKAGADSVVSSNLIGGLRMVSELIRPEVVSFLDLMLRDREKNLRIEEMTIAEGSALAGKTAREAKKHGLLLAVKHADRKSFDPNPPDDYQLMEGMALILMLSPEERLAVEALTNAK